MLPTFQVLQDSPQGRLGRITTAHGIVETPEFVFCATKGSVRGLGPWDLERLGAQIILSNTYHLLLTPGEKGIREVGGGHGLSGWRGPMLTDSGGFQVFCLGGHGSVSDEIKGRNRGQKSTLISITEEGVWFKSYRDGSNLLLTPEKSIQFQKMIGADLIVNFDECTPLHISYEDTRASLLRTNRWQERGLRAFGDSDQQGLYCVVQGGLHFDLRTLSMDYCNKGSFFGYAIGGSLGKDLEDMERVLSLFHSLRIPHRPVHLLGMGGKIREIFRALSYGVDTFDCVHPTRVARHGIAVCPYKVSEKGFLNLWKSTSDGGPIDPDCPCMTCRYYSRTALHYLLRAGEMTALVALTEHNVATMVRLMREVRQGLREKCLESVRNKWCG